MFTMGDVARCSLAGEDVLYKLFGVNAELLIDHAWGWESCTLEDIKTYRPSANSLGSGQVLHCPYSFDKARLILQEMVDLLAMDLLDKGLVTDKLVLTIGFDRENLTDPVIRAKYSGGVCLDHYGRPVPQHAHGTANLHRRCASARLMIQAMLELYDRIVKNGGLADHLGTSDAREIVARIESGDKYAKLVYDAFIRQLAKAVGGCATVLKGQVDAIIFTGGIAHDKYLVEKLSDYIGWIAPISVQPGEFEMEALSAGAIRALKGEEEVLQYTGIPVFENFDHLKQ
jgi:hypothetical protein